MLRRDCAGRKRNPAGVWVWDTGKSCGEASGQAGEENGERGGQRGEGKESQSRPAPVLWALHRGAQPRGE